MIFYHAESESLFAEPNPPFDSPLWDHCVTVDPCELKAGTVITTSLKRPSVVLPSFDFETSSEAGYYYEPVPPDPTGKWTPPYKVKGMGGQSKGGLPVVGTAVYAEHPSTEVKSMVYDLKDGKGRRWWAPGFPLPVDLLAYIANGGLIEAWNVTFEFFIWNLVCVKKYGFPPLPRSQCRCAMAKSRRYSLPGSLDNSAAVLGTPKKDAKGSQLINKLLRPHTPTKTRPGKFWDTANAWDDFVALYKYNDGDVISEDHAAAHIPDLSPYELATWQLDQTVNIRGVQVDTQALDAALVILASAEATYTQELQAITSGQVNSVSEVARFQDWLSRYGVRVHDMRKETVAEILKSPVLPANCRRALEIRELLGSANVKKLRKLRLQVNKDGRLRNQYMYCGADRTGRWSSAAADDNASNSQLQNITAKGPKTAQCESCNKIFGAVANPKSCPRCNAWTFKELPEWDIEAVEQAIGDIKTFTHDLARLEAIWGPAIAVLCGCLRGLFIAAEGKKLVCCDFSAIEAVAAACLARCQWRIDVFGSHGKIYEESGAKAAGITFEEVIAYKKEHGVHHPARKKGKVRELANGYGGWIAASKNFGAGDIMTDDEIKADILKWRAESPEIVNMWGGQWVWCGPGKWDYRPELYGLEGCAVNAIQNPGKCFSHYDITYAVSDDILFCRLPSGRFLHYHKPRLVPSCDNLGRPIQQITFEGYNSNATKGPIGWGRWETYGGRLFENVVQAVSCDLQAEALIRCEAAGYSIVMHTHDEGCAEVPEGFGSPEEMCKLMTTRPAWASWWPIRAAGWEHKRYQKD
jgi:DNA polymerase